MSATAPARAVRRAPHRARRLPAAVWLLIAPFLLFFAVTYLAPIVSTIWQSLFTEKSGGGLGLTAKTTEFAGLDNYAQAVTDPAFWSGMGRVLLFGVVQVPIMLLVALCLALLLDSFTSRLRTTFRLAYFLPYAVPGVIAALVWAYLYVPDLSPIVELLHGLGIPADFLASNTVLWSMANITTWNWTGYKMIILISALQAIPRDQFEAARLDGASAWQIAWKIKVPNIKAAIGLAVLMSIIGSVQLFNEPTVIRTVSSNVSSDFLPMLMVYNAAFTQQDMGYAGALAIVMSVITGVLVFGYYRISTLIERKG